MKHTRMTTLALCLLLICIAATANTETAPFTLEEMVSRPTPPSSLQQLSPFAPVALSPEAFRGQLEGITEKSLHDTLQAIGLPTDSMEMHTLAAYGSGILTFEEVPVGGRLCTVAVVSSGTEQDNLSAIFVRDASGEWRLTDCLTGMSRLEIITDYARTNAWLVGWSYGSGTGFWAEFDTWYNLHTRAVELCYTPILHDSWDSWHFGVLRTTDNLLRETGATGYRMLHYTGALILRRYVSQLTLEETPGATLAPDTSFREVQAYAEADIYRYDPATYTLQFDRTRRFDDLSFATLEWLDTDTMLSEINQIIKD